jgi:hypothetical protein
MLRKDKLYKPCSKCEKLFEPTTRYSKLCEKCFKNSMLKRGRGKK